MNCWVQLQRKLNMDACKILFVLFFTIVPLSSSRSVRPTNSSNIANLHLTRGRLDKIWHDCWGAGRTTGPWSKEWCVCKEQYGTVMSQSGHIWDCRTNSEVLCDHTLIEEDGNTDLKNVHVINRSSYSVSIVPQLPDGLSIKNISVWNYRSSITDGRFRGHWDIMTDVARYFFKTDIGNNHLTISNLNLTLWQGQLVKIHFGEFKKCVHAKISGPIMYPFNVTEFRRQVPTPKPPPPTTEPTKTPTSPTELPTSPTRKSTTRAVSTHQSRFFFLMNLKLNFKAKFSEN